MAVESINIDFQVLDTRDPRVLSVADYSSWGHIQTKPSIIEIVLPGDTEPIVHYFNKKEINIFHSVNLNLNCPSNCIEGELIELPDGIYGIILKGSPDVFQMQRNYLRTELLQLDLDKLFVNVDLLCKNVDKDLIDRLVDIDMLLKSAEANVRLDNICKAQELLFEAQDLLIKAKHCSGCVDV